MPLVKGCMLALPCRKSRRRRAMPARRPPSCRRIISERERDGSHSGITNTPPLPSAQLSSHCQHKRLHWRSLWRDPVGIFVPYMAAPLPSEPTQEPECFSWGKAHLSPNARWIPIPPSFRSWVLVLGWEGLREGVGLWLSLIVFVPHGECLQNYHRRKLIQDINFF